MLTTLILGIVLGAMLSVRFNVVILIPGTFLTLVVVAFNGIVHGEGIWAVAQLMAGAAAALQVGYFLGSVLPLVVSPRRSDGRRDSSIPTGASRPT
jgi:hypothetical protein